jgi:hypothetical protein
MPEPLGHTLYRGTDADKVSEPPTPHVSDMLYISAPIRRLGPGRYKLTRRPPPGPLRHLADPPLSCYPARGKLRSSWPSGGGPAGLLPGPPGPGPSPAIPAPPR